MSSLVLPCLGLADDAHALAAPKGSMRTAENVVCDLPGVVRARPNFDVGANKSTTYKPISMYVWGGTPILVSRDGSNWRLESQTGTYTGNAEPVDYDARETSWAEARRSLYYCTSTGVRRLGSTADAGSVEAGMDVAGTISPGAFCFLVSATEYGPFDGAFSVSYVLVVKRTDSNGYIKRSPPTSRFTVRNSGITTKAMEIAIGATSTKRIAFASGSLIAGDEIEVYRTRTVASATGTPSADLYLVLTYTLTSTDVSNGYFPASGTSLYDKVSDDELGEALYTNPQQQGALRAKYGPPIAQDVALWNGCLWFGRVKERQRLVVTLREVGQDNASAAIRDEPTATGIGYRHTDGVSTNTGDLASGSPTISNVVNVTGVAVGDYVSNGDTPFKTAASNKIPSGTTVLTITGAGPYTVTMSQNATGTAVGTDIEFFSKITIDGVGFAAGGDNSLGQSGDRRTFDTDTSATQADRAERTAANLVRAINDAAAANQITVRAYHVGGLGAPTGATGGGGQFILERTTLSGASFTFTSTKPQAFQPQLGSGLTSSQEDRRNRVYYSLPNEPEAVPLVAYIDIGSEAAPIRRLIPLRDALMVFKDDGLYRITGSAPDNWTVDLVDPTIRLIRPEAVDVMDDSAFAFTDRGFCEINESGVMEIHSAGKIDLNLFPSQTRLLGDATRHGCQVTCFRRWHLVLLTTPPDTTGIRYSDTVWCFAQKTGNWTQWPSMYWRTADYDPSSGRTYVAVNNALDELEWETRYTLDTPQGFDRRYASLTWTATAGSTAMSITNAQRGEWVPRMGDWVAWKVGAVDSYRRIVAVVAAGGGDYSWTLDAAAPSDIGSATDRYAYEGAPVLLEWLPSAMGTAGMSLGVWRELTFQMDGLASSLASPTTARITFGVRHDGAAAIPTVVGTPARATVQTRPYRMGWPREASRRPIVAPRLGWSELYWDWRFAGVTLVGELGNEKVRR